MIRSIQPEILYHTMLMRHPTISNSTSYPDYAAVRQWHGPMMKKQSTLTEWSHSQNSQNVWAYLCVCKSDMQQIIYFQFSRILRRTKNCLPDKMRNNEIKLKFSCHLYFLFYISVIISWCNITVDLIPISRENGI